MAKAYRFHGVAGLNTEAGTVYLPAADAAALGRALIRVAQSLKAGEEFADWSSQTEDVADFATPSDAHNVADMIRRGLIRYHQTSPGTWHGRYRAKPKGRFQTVRNGTGLPIAYTSPRAALAGAAYTGGRS